MKKRVIIIHGWEGSPEGNWFPWLKIELEKLGYKVAVPAMPNSAHPKLEEWLVYLQEAIGQPDENLYLIGHSLGVITILRYFELLPENMKIGGAILVAGFPESIGYKELNSFFQKSLDYKKIRKSAKRFIAIHSDNDPYVPLRNGELLKNELGAELVVIKDAGHLNAEFGFYQLPVVLEKLKEI